MSPQNANRSDFLNVETGISISDGMLVTGASGFIGRELVKTLSLKGINGVATGRTRPPTLPAGWEALSRNEVLDAGALRFIPRRIVHLEVRQHVANPTPAQIVEFQGVNIDGTKRWLDWATAVGIKTFVFASSVKAVRIVSGVAFEDAAPEDQDPYGQSKAAAEEAVREWAKADPSRQATILRFAPVYGPGNVANLAAFARQVMRGKPCYIGNGDTRKSVVSLRNAVTAILHALDTPSAGLRTFNCSDADSLSVFELAHMIAAAANSPRPRGIPKGIARAAAIFSDAVQRIAGVQLPLTSARLQALTTDATYPPEKLVGSGFRHAQTTEQGIREMVEWICVSERVAKT